MRFEADDSMETKQSPFTSFHFQFCWLSFQHPFGLSSVDFFPADVEDGTCGVGSCSCGAWADMHCTNAASLNPYCLVAWRAMICNGNRGIWLIYYGLFGRIWTNLDEFGGCSTDVLLAPPVILACSIVRYCSSIVCLPLRRLRMMLFDVIRNISWHQEEFVLVRGFLWFLDVSWCFVLPTWEFHRDSPSTPHQRLTNAAPTPHQRLTNAAPTPHQGNRCTTVFGGLIQSQRCTWFAAFHCVPWHRKIAKRSEKESLPYVSSWCFMFHDVSLKIFKIYLCDSCDCDVLWYLIISYN